MGKISLIAVTFTVAILLFNLPIGWGQTASEDTQEDRLEEALEEKKMITSTEELIELLKQRALRKVEEKRREQLRGTKGIIGLHIGYDNNVNTDSDRREDFYCEQYFSFNWTPTFNDYFAAEIGPWYYSDMYFDTKDTTLWDYAFKGILKFYPTGKPEFELQPGLEWAHAYYPDSETSTHTDNKAFLKFKHRFWKRWSHEGKYEYSFKEYDKKHPRTTTSTSYVIGQALEKTRHSVEYTVRFPVGKNNCKIKQKFYEETSNDHYQDYYDVYSYKVTGEIGRSLIKRLYAKLSLSYERKNYQYRRVLPHHMAQYDNLYTPKLSLYYTLKKGWTLSYAVTYKKSDSNSVSYDYDKLSQLAGVYISF